MMFLYKNWSASRNLVKIRRPRMCFLVNWDIIENIWKSVESLHVLHRSVAFPDNPCRKLTIPQRFFAGKQFRSIPVSFSGNLMFFFRWVHVDFILFERKPSHIRSIPCL